MIEKNSRISHDLEDLNRDFKPIIPLPRTAFNVPQGVNCFDYNANMNIIATGDVDLMVRLWNPYVKKPVGVCLVSVKTERGHMTNLT